MNSVPRYARLASKLFVREWNSLPAAEPAPAARAKAIQAVSQAITARRRKRRTMRAAVGVLALAAACAVTVEAARLIRIPGAPPAPAQGVQIVAHSVGGTTNVVLSGSQAPLGEGHAIVQGSRLVTPTDGRASLEFSTGTSALVGEGSDLALGGDGATQLLRLTTGWVDLHVARLSPGQRFLIDTPDAEIEVRGTRFQVSIAPSEPGCGAGTITRVAVTEGVVAVRHSGAEVSLAAGQRWPDGCGPAAPIRAAIAPAIRPTQRLSPPGASAPSVSASTLADENNLFAQALAAKRRGDLRGALAAFERFVARFPDAALAESAYVERMRLLRVLAMPRAVAAAREYTTIYPGGFARSEAEAIVAGSL